MSLSRVFAHDGSGDRIVAADSNAKNKPKADQPPNLWRECTSYSSGAENKHLRLHRFVCGQAYPRSDRRALLRLQKPIKQSTRPVVLLPSPHAIEALEAPSPHR